MTSKRHSYVCAAALGLGVALGLAAVQPAIAQDKPVTLRLGHWLPPSHPLHPAFTEWGASLEKATNGTVKTQMRRGLIKIRELLGTDPRPEEGP